MAILVDKTNLLLGAWKGDASDYANNSNILINPVIPKGAPEYWKYENDTLSFKNQTDRDIVDAIKAQNKAENNSVGLVVDRQGSRKEAITGISGKIVLWLIQSGETADENEAQNMAKDLMETYENKISIFERGKSLPLVAAITNDSNYSWLDNNIPYYSDTIRNEILTMLNGV